jgi:hypothetical protein|tara:strand:- start:500 stop:1210 length:711 start_codon:yes stop_codon:yes gene_type:complete
MHKKLEAELVSIAHSILQMKNRDDITALHKKAQKLQEQLAVLMFVDDYLETTPEAKESREELIEKIETVVDKPIEVAVVKEVNVEQKVFTLEDEEVVEEEKPEVVLNLVPEKEVVEVKEIKKQLSFEEELKGTVSVDVTADLFQKSETKTKTKSSLNDTLNQENIQVGLNDRIAFVKHLFNNSQADFNRVLSQLNSFKTEKEARNFIKKMVKPDYDWTGKEEYEERFLDLVDRKFL